MPIEKILLMAFALVWLPCVVLVIPWLAARVLGHWVVVKDTGPNVYLQNSRTGVRKVHKREGWGHQPINQYWLDTGVWRGLPTKPPMK